MKTNTERTGGVRSMLNIPSHWFRSEQSANKPHPFMSLAWYLSDIESDLTDKQAEQIREIMEHISVFENQLVTGEELPVNVPVLPRVPTSAESKEAFHHACINSNMVNSITYDEFMTLYYHLTNSLKICNQGAKK